MTPTQLDNIRRSHEAVADRGEELSDRFFARLFAMQPVLRAILPRDQWQRTRDLLAGLGLVVREIEKPGAVQHLLMDFGAKAERTGISPHQYGMARQALVAAMRETMGAEWTEDLEQDWTDALNSVASVVVLGAGRSRARAA
jgi:hemoglobin-like flavoprotein